MRPINVGVIGLGWFGEKHCEVLSGLREEWVYFLRCVAEGRKPEVIRPEESRATVAACLAAKRSAATTQVVLL